MTRYALALVALLLALPALGQTPPDERDTVIAVRSTTGSLIAENSMLFTDAVCAALAKKDPNWGRKARRDGDWSSRNSDALAYKFGDNSNKALVDIVACSHLPGEPPPDCTPSTSWQVYPGPNTGNGFWMACTSVTPPNNPPTDPPTDPPTVDLSSVLARLDALQAKVETLTQKVDQLQDPVTRAAYESYNAAVRTLDILNAQKELAARPFPSYRGSIPFLGGFTLTPQK